jgi:flagellin-like hook-associated protein FlgL
MSDISLNAGIRSNLLQLQSSAKLFNRTTERLSSGKSVNSAIDNPTNFFASVNLNDRATGLSARLDGMGQAVQRIQAADNGITTIRGFISAMKGIVNNALGNTDADARDALGSQFNELVVQISQTAKDSGYAGINLLERNETETVQFNETFDASTLDVKGFNLLGPGTDGRGVVDTNGEIESASVTATISQASVAAASASGFSATSAGNTTVALTGGSGYTALAATASAAIGTAQDTNTTASQGYGIVLEQQDGSVVGIRGANDAGGTGMVDWGGASYKTDLAAVVEELEAFDEELKTQASNLAQNLATITIREEFSNELINTLTEGADKLTLADLNEEGANLLALQTSQALATQSLALASQQSQQVLQLLG